MRDYPWPPDDTWPAWTQPLSNRVKNSLVNMVGYRDDYGDRRMLPDLELATLKAAQPRELLRGYNFGRLALDEVRKAIGGFDCEAASDRVPPALTELGRFIRLAAETSSDPDIKAQARALLGWAR